MDNLIGVRCVATVCITDSGLPEDPDIVAHAGDFGTIEEVHEDGLYVEFDKSGVGCLVDWDEVKPALALVA